MRDGYVLAPNKCEKCGGPVYAKAKKDGEARKRRFCSAECRDPRSTGKTRADRTAESIKRRTFTCQCCGQQYVAKTLDRNKYCSRECAYKDQQAWNKFQKHGPHSKLPKYTLIAFRECAHCGSAFVTRLHGGKTYCSSTCSSNAAWARKKAGILREREPVNCKECGVEFWQIHGASEFCCDTHSKRYTRRHQWKNHRDRARHAGVMHERVDPFAVFERDGWRCKACGCDTPKALRGTSHDDAPELDHIIPVSKGGSHTYGNTQLLCRTCNILKGDKWNGEFIREIKGLAGGVSKWTTRL